MVRGIRDDTCCDTIMLRNLKIASSQGLSGLSLFTETAIVHTLLLRIYISPGKKEKKKWRGR
jgi:hypothetical protein